MASPPRIWLEYRPVRIGWVVSGRALAQLATAASWSACLWGGQFNPIIPMPETDEATRLADNLVGTFGVDILIPLTPSAGTDAFIARFPHLSAPMGCESVFADGLCHFVDIRHAVFRLAKQERLYLKPVFPTLLQMSWDEADPLSSLFAAWWTTYPDPDGLRINYPRGISSSLKTESRRVEREGALPADLAEMISPIELTAFELRWRPQRSHWNYPGVVLGNAADFDDLVLLWNLRAAGIDVRFYDRAHAARLKQHVASFAAEVREDPGEEDRRFCLWSRSEQWDHDLDFAGLHVLHCQARDDVIWTGMNIEPVRPSFSYSHRDVVPSYSETDGRAAASFGLPDQPFDESDVRTASQHFVVTINASQYGPARDDMTFNTPYVPRLNEFYGRNFHYDYARARAEPGAMGIIETVGTQRAEIRAIRVLDFIRALLEPLGVKVERSEPGRRCSRLIRQLGGVQGCRVLKVLGARELIERYGPDQSFTRSAAEQIIGNVDPQTGRTRFTEFEDLYIEPRDRGKLQPAHVFQYLVSRGVFRVGLDLKCPNCELEAWIPLDDVKTNSACVYCGFQFEITTQLKDRDWRYRRSGLFGRDDSQLGSIPVALTIQQLDTSLKYRIAMYSTALEVVPNGADIERCEVDFLAIVAGAKLRGETPVQILVGEAKTHGQINDDDIRKLGKLVNAIPRTLAQTFVMFSKTDAFTDDEVRLAKSLNTQLARRVIMWSQSELEPYRVYERSEAALGERMYTVTLTQMVQATHRLWFDNAGTR